MQRRIVLAAALLATSSLAVPSVAGAQASGRYPDRPIRLILPFSAGGPTDTLGRVFAEQISKQMGARVVVENRTGAGSTIGADAVAKAAPDGYTLLFTNLSHSINPSLYRHIPYDTVADFVPVSVLMEGPVVVLVGANSPYRSLKNLVDAVRAKPDHYDYGSAGNGSAAHVSMVQILARTGARMNHIVYRGVANAMTDLLSGTIASVNDTSTTALGSIRGGLVRPLAVTSPTRVPFLPDLPTVRESSIPELADFQMSTWNMLLAPAGTPQPIVDRLHREVQAAMRDQPFVAKLAELGNVPMPEADLAGTRAFLVSEMERWRDVMQQAGIRPE
ncbi:tripartite tricarboxylate transporter substrate binding protein [Pseudoroseomonas wenyumeiae]|uniref:Tripartite tricarboxylate transporter substrate binding protein n=1 Tax=Teichococcus wenyumeiae TaxID=2478470 RepID=A0A3A9J8B1_9PROT|nr:tripartite tricarboxylate transporter substrate binding protein [Pseudoroseomonas wenyumeiae]RKK03497.1 tripartite tricarboxylate transporter substrate binding protein [Pseudoroseomonas wenyumeiae]RMI16992.1 tripartite tricarboxylate transporter substrate binding protein [Pseudoroseomonas wenyumeiae]